MTAMEHHDPEWIWPRGFVPSLHYLESKADGVVHPKSGGYVIATCDYTADRADAARHVSGLKKGVIALPSNVDEMESWYLDFIKSRSRQRRHRDEFLAELRDRGLLVSFGKLPGDSK